MHHIYVVNTVKTIYDIQMNLTVLIIFKRPEINRFADKRKPAIGIFLDTEFNVLSINANSTIEIIFAAELCHCNQPCFSYFQL